MSTTKKKTTKAAAKKTTTKAAAKKTTTRKATTRAGKTAKTQYVPSEVEIRQRAFEIFMQRGGEPGREMEDWLQAEHELCQN